MLACAASASAQNLNQQVQVTNDYMSDMSGVAKPATAFSVPDTLLKFDYNFDYSVFDNPYKGAYEFSPYSVRVTPEASVYDGTTLYVRAGAGYTLHPELYAVWSPVRNGRARVSLYQDGYGYAGRYRNLNATLQAIQGSFFKGYDFREKAGARGSFLFPSSELSWDVHYLGRYNSNGLNTGFYHSATAGLRIKSLNAARNAFNYDVSIKGTYGQDNFVHMIDNLRVPGMNLAFDASFGPVRRRVFSLAFDVRAGYQRYPAEDKAVWNAGVTPKFIFRHGIFDISAGAALDMAGALGIHPDVSVSADIVKGRVKLSGGLKGGLYRSSYSDLKENVPFYYPVYSGDYTTVTDEKFNAWAGLSGELLPQLSYSLKGGYASYDDAPLMRVRNAGGYLWSGVTYVDYAMAYADLFLGYKNPRVEADADFRFRRTNLTQYTYMVDLPMFSGDFRFVYNLMERIYFGVSLSFETPRLCAYEDKAFNTPFWISPGISAEYKLDSRWSVWLRGDNLAGMAAREIPTMVEQGVNFTAGICLSL